MTNKTTSAIDLVMERVNKFVTCGCCDDDWPPLRRDIADTITRLQAALDWQRDLLGRWLATADTGPWRDKAELSVAAHPVAEDTRAALSSVGGE